MLYVPRPLCWKQNSFIILNPNPVDTRNNFCGMHLNCVPTISLRCSVSLRSCTNKETRMRWRAYLRRQSASLDLRELMRFAVTFQASNRGIMMRALRAMRASITLRMRFIW